MRPFSQSRHRPLSATTAAVTTLLSLSLSSLIQPAFANPYPKDELHNTLAYGYLQDRLCASYCGVENELCCSSSEACVTANSVAACAAVTVATKVIYPRQDDSWSLYTSTWTVTATYTTTGSSYWGEPTSTTPSIASCIPQALGQTNCGSICCASDQICVYDGQCTAKAGGGGVATGTSATSAMTTYPTTITTAGSTITTQFSAPYRVTGTAATTTNTGTIESATTTSSGNGTAVASGTGGSTLSGGAIAGIVIGVLAGVVLLLTICACCIMRGLWHGALAILGLGGKKKRSSSRDRETVIIEEERYARRGSNSHAARNSHGSWFARNPARSAAGESRRTSEKVRTTDSNKAGWWGAGAVGTLMLLLGLRRDKKRRSSSVAKRSSRPRSDVSSSYFSDSYTASSPSEFSSEYTYSSVYTPVQSHHPRDASRPPSVVRSPVRTQSVARSASRGAGGAGRVYRDEYEPMTKPPPDYAGSASSGGRTRDTRRSRRTETTRMSRAQSRR